MKKNATNSHKVWGNIKLNGISNHLLSLLLLPFLAACGQHVASSSAQHKTLSCLCKNCKTITHPVGALFWHWWKKLLMFRKLSSFRVLQRKSSSLGLPPKSMDLYQLITHILPSQAVSGQPPAMISLFECRSLLALRSAGCNSSTENLPIIN